jgi:hypothetical protein
VQAFIERGIAEGPRSVCGGTGRPTGFTRGYFARPTIFANVTSDMMIAKGEIFGPVLSIMIYETEDEAVAIANDTAHGLAGYVQGSDIDQSAMSRRESAPDGFTSTAHHLTAASRLAATTIGQWPRARDVRFRRTSRGEGCTWLPRA